jgi:hypothetical protein
VCPLAIATKKDTLELPAVINLSTKWAFVNIQYRGYSSARVSERIPWMSTNGLDQLPPE